MLENLTRAELRKINGGMEGIGSLGAARRRKILLEFTKSMKAYARRRSEELDTALLLSVFVISLVTVLSFIYAQFQFRSVDRTIDFIESVFARGGMHLAAYPFLRAIVISEYHVSPSRLLSGLKRPAGDIASALAAGALMMLLFLPEALGGRDASPFALKVFHAAVSLTAGPAAEELFFRYMLFMRPGRKYGYAACAVVSSALFAAVHLPGSWGLGLRYFAAGLTLCGVCRYRKNLFAPFGAHVLANLSLLAV